MPIVANVSARTAKAGCCGTKVLTTTSGRAGSAGLVERGWDDMHDRGMVCSGGLPGLGQRH